MLSRLKLLSVSCALAVLVGCGSSNSGTHAGDSGADTGKLADGGKDTGPVVDTGTPPDTGMPPDTGVDSGMDSTADTNADTNADTTPPDTNADTTPADTSTDTTPTDTTPAVYTVGGTLSGLGTGDTVVLQDNAGDNLSVSANGSFTFATPLTSGAAFSVTVLTQPTGETCTVMGGTGTVTSANVTSVVVTALRMVTVRRLRTAARTTPSVEQSAA